MSGIRTAKRSAPFLQRLAAAVLGGYLLANAWVVFCGALSQPLAESILVGMQFSFAIHGAAVIWAFSPVSLARVWQGLLITTVLLSAAAFVLMHWRG